MKKIIRALLPVAALVALPLATDVASAAVPPPAPSKVTIDREGADMFGTVSSKKASCEGDRTVQLFKQQGKKGGGDDHLVVTDTTEVQNGVGVWSTGNTGVAGKLYAKVKKTPTCKGAVSPTIVVPTK